MTHFPFFDIHVFDIASNPFFSPSVNDGTLCTERLCECSSIQIRDGESRCICGHSVKKHKLHSTIQEALGLLLFKCVDVSRGVHAVKTLFSCCKMVNATICGEFAAAVRALATRNTQNSELQALVVELGTMSISDSGDEAQLSLLSTPKKDKSAKESRAQLLSLSEIKRQQHGTVIGESGPVTFAPVRKVNPMALKRSLLDIVFTWSRNPGLPVDSFLSEADKKGAESGSETSKGHKFFNDSNEYVRVFKRMFLTELHAQLFEEEGSSSDPSATVFLKQCNEDPMYSGEYCRLVYVPQGDSTEDLRENDVVWLWSTTAVDPEKITDENMKVRTLAVVGEKPHIPRMRRAVSLELFFGGHDASAQELRNVFAVARSKFCFVANKFGNISTALREWTAMRMVSEMPLCDDILHPTRHNAPAQLTCDVPKNTMDLLLQSCGLNESQKNAVEYTVSGKGFRLVQGPPGTGKTQTILSIVSALLLEPNRKTLLVCAPSNAAVDEIATRLLQRGVWEMSADGQRMERRLLSRGRLLRIGVTENCSKLLQSVTLDEMLRVMSEDSKMTSLESKNEQYRKILNETNLELQKVLEKIEGVRKELDSNGGLSETKERLRELKEKRDGCQARIKEAKKCLESNTLKRKRQREEDVRKVISQADIICCTLSFAGSSVLLNKKYRTVLVDEAAQCVELETLIPLQHMTERCILVGDPAQLPATVLSKELVRSSLYTRSLFQRLMECRHRPVFLDTQYRMHPHIAAFPSCSFYSRRLLNAPSVLNIREPFYDSHVFAPFVVFDLSWTREEQRNGSYRNKHEALFCVMLVREFRNRVKGQSIGVITPYKQQQAVLRSHLKEYQDVEVNTVDGFQGREKDVIVFSCVRGASDQRGVGFLRDVRRMNVAITRAKKALWIVGNGKQLCTEPLWKQLFSCAQKNGLRAELSRDDVSKFDLVQRKMMSLPMIPPDKELDISGVSEPHSVFTDRSQFAMPKISYTPASEQVGTSPSSVAQPIASSRPPVPVARSPPLVCPATVSTPKNVPAATAAAAAVRTSKPSTPEGLVLCGSSKKPVAKSRNPETESQPKKKPARAELITYIPGQQSVVQGSRGTMIGPSRAKDENGVFRPLVPHSRAHPVPPRPTTVPHPPPVSAPNSQAYLSTVARLQNLSAPVHVPSSIPQQPRAPSMVRPPPQSLNQYFPQAPKPSNVWPPVFHPR